LFLFLLRFLAACDIILSMGILSLIILNAWRKYSSPRNLRISAMTAVIILAATQLLILMVIIPGFGKIPVSFSVSVRELIDPAGRSFWDIWLIFVNTLVLAALKFKVPTLAAGALFALFGALSINAFGDRIIEEKRLVSAVLSAILIGAVLVLPVFEFGPYIILAMSATAGKV